MTMRGLVVSRAAPEVATALVACHHHWIIDIPNGPSSSGICRDCGERRDFPNFQKDGVYA